MDSQDNHEKRPESLSDSLSGLRVGRGKGGEHEGLRMALTAFSLVRDCRRSKPGKIGHDISEPSRLSRKTFLWSKRTKRIFTTNPIYYDISGYSSICPFLPKCGPAYLGKHPRKLGWNLNPDKMDTTDMSEIL